MTKKKLLIYYPSFERGGVEENLKNLINTFSSKVDLHLISSISQKDTRGISNKNCKFYNVKKSQILNFLPSRINSALSSMFLLFKLIKRLKKKNLVVHSMQSNIAAIIVCFIANVKIVIRNSEDPIYSTIYSENKIFSFFIFFLKIVFYNLCDCIVTNSYGSKKSLTKIVLNKNKIVTIYNPYLKKINRKKFKKKNIIINIGRFRKQKNQILLIKAFYEFSKIHKQYKLLLIGDGILKNRLLSEISNLDLNNKVFLCGWTNNTLKYVKNAKLFVFTSLYEGLGNVLIDAINYDVPCISTNCKSGPKEILLNGKGGTLSKNNDVYDLSQKMIYCIKNYSLVKKKNNISKKHLKRFLMNDRSKDYQKLLIKYIN